jgi:hypothetical protein
VPSYIMVLNDGETYTGLTNCKIIAVDEELFNEHDDYLGDDAIKDIYNGVGTEQGKIVAEFTQDGMTTVAVDGLTVTFK